MRGGDEPSLASWSTLSCPTVARSFRDRAMVGRRVRVFCGIEPASVWRALCSPELQAALFLGDAKGEAGWVDTNGREIVEPFKGPCVLIVPSGVPHWIRLQTTTEVIAIFAKTEYFDEVTKGARLCAELFPLRPCIAEDHLIADLVAAFAEFRNRRLSPGRNEIDGAGGLLALRLIAAHLAPGRREREEHSGLSDAVLESVLSHIRENLAEKLSREILARVAGVSQWHFARLFKLSTGKTPGRYVMDLRLETAKSWLSAGKRSITTVAHDVGFCDHNQLAYNFKRKFGVSPGVMKTQPAPTHRTNSSLKRTKAGEIFVQSL